MRRAERIGRGKRWLLIPSAWPSTPTADRCSRSMRNRPGIAGKCHVVPAAAVPDDTAEADFHLTRSPYCSSLLRPDAAALGDWDFARLFDVERTVRVPCVSLSKAVRDVGVTRVDWFKTDSQGIDLRLFQSLGEEQCSRRCWLSSSNQESSTRTRARTKWRPC